LTIRAYHVKNVKVFEFLWKFENLEQVLSTYFDFIRLDNSVGIEMNIYSLNLEFPIMVTGIYTGSNKKLLKYLKPFIDINPNQQKIYKTTV